MSTRNACPECGSPPQIIKANRKLIRQVELLQKDLTERRETARRASHEAGGLRRRLANVTSKLKQMQEEAKGVKERMALQIEVQRLAYQKETIEIERDRARKERDQVKRSFAKLLKEVSKIKKAADNLYTNTKDLSGK